jgi:hypothetical protein
MTQMRWRSLDPQHSLRPLPLTIPANSVAVAGMVSVPWVMSILVSDTSKQAFAMVCLS